MHYFTDFTGLDNHPDLRAQAALQQRPVDRRERQQRRDCSFVAGQIAVRQHNNPVPGAHCGDCLRRQVLQHLAQHRVVGTLGEAAFEYRRGIAIHAGLLQAVKFGIRQHWPAQLDQPGVFRDLFPQGTGGLHHVAVVCDDYDRDRDAYLAAGVELAFEGFAGPSRTSWVDTSPTLGFMVELLERSDMRDGFFAHMKKAAQRWDGTEPIVGRT